MEMEKKKTLQKVGIVKEIRTMYPLLVFGRVLSFVKKRTDSPVKRLIKVQLTVTKMAETSNSAESICCNWIPYFGWGSFSVWIFKRKKNVFKEQ